MPSVLPPHLAYVTRSARDLVAKKQMETFDHDPWKAQDAVRSLFDEVLQVLRAVTVALDEVADRRDISLGKRRRTTSRPPSFARHLTRAGHHSAFPNSERSLGFSPQYQRRILAEPEDFALGPSLGANSPVHCYCDSQAPSTGVAEEELQNHPLAQPSLHQICPLPPQRDGAAPGAPAGPILPAGPHLSPGLVDLPAPCPPLCLSAAIIAALPFISSEFLYSLLLSSR